MRMQVEPDVERAAGTNRRAIPLVEPIVLAVLFLSLAAIVTPQIAGAKEDPADAIADASLRMLADQIDLYHARTGTLPTASMMSRPAAGETEGSFGGLIDAGYLDAAPLNPYTGGRTLPGDWVYEQQSGRVFAVRP